MEAIVLAGGFGTRLAHVVPDVPKPMAPVCGKPFLYYVLSDLARKGVKHAVLAVGYKRECIWDHFGTHFSGMELSYSAEQEPLLTGGAIRQAIGHCAERDVFVVNGDTFFDVDLQEMARVHERNCAVLTVAAKLMENFDRYGTIQADEDGRIRRFCEKLWCERGYINGGIYLIRRQELLDLAETRFSFEKEYMEPSAAKKPVYMFPSEGYFIDIGVPQDYQRAQTEFANFGFRFG